MSTFENVTYNDFRESAALFFRSTESTTKITLDQAENGFKALSLLYFAGAEDWLTHQVHEACIILDLAAKRVFEIQYAEIRKQH